MLRHIRMTTKVDAHRMPARLSAAIRDALRALYPLTVSHRTHTFGEPDPVCCCRYPLYSLCTPEPSPYDLHEPALAPIPLLPAPGTTMAPSSSSPGGASLTDSVSSAGCSAHGEAAASAPASSSSAAHNSSSTAAKTRPALRLQRLWRGRAQPAVYQRNVVPHRTTCYRCDICDSFQRFEEDEEESQSEPQTEPLASQAAATAASHAESGTRCDDADGRGSAAATSGAVGAGSTSSPGHETAQTAAPAREVADDGDDDEEKEDEEFGGQPVSTDISTTIMEDTQVAQLRYLDPFLVEVLGQPNKGPLSRKLVRLIQAQFTRCGTSAKDMTRRTRRAIRTGTSYAKLYDDWVAAQLEQKRLDTRERRGRAVEARMQYLQKKVDLLDTASYAARFAVASYGLAYELGYFNSFQDVMRLQGEPHRRYTCATSEEQMESMRRMLQGEQPNELMEFATSRYSVAVGRPCYAVVLDHARRRVVLAFRGTLTLPDVLVDVAEGYVEVDLRAPGADGATGVQAGAAKVMVPLADLPVAQRRRYGALSVTAREAASAGEDKSAEQPAALATGEQQDSSPVSQQAEEPIRTRVPLGFYAAVREASTKLVPQLEVIHAEYPDYDLLITGHSLGAIEASVFHLLYCFPHAKAAVPFRRVQTVGIGCAPIVETACVAALNRALRADEELHGDRLVCFSFGKDAITRLHVRGVLQAFMENAAPTTNETREAALCTDSAKSSTKTARKKTTASPSTGSPPSACAAAPTPLPSLSVLPQLDIPGTLYNIPHALRRSFFEVPLDCPWRGQVILSVEAFFHHFPIHYARAFTRLLQHYEHRLAELRAGASKPAPRR